MNATEALIEVRDLVVSRGSFRLRVPRWRVAPGRIVGVVGPNAAGKSTLLGHVAGLLDPSPGRVRVFGLDPIQHPVEVRQQLGWMTDDLPLWNLRGRSLLHRLSGYWPTWDPALVERLVERFEVPLDTKVSDLSKGAGTRLRLVLAMAFRPRLLVLDEPGTGLDLAGRRALLAEVLEVAADADRAVVISSHQLADVQRIADELLVIADGRVVRQGPTDELVGEARTLVPSSQSLSQCRTPSVPASSRQLSGCSSRCWCSSPRAWFPASWPPGRHRRTSDRTRHCPCVPPHAAPRTPESQSCSCGWRGRSATLASPFHCPCR